ncbi:MAG: type 1 glutamine amidotransferase, partial [Natronosporangium sp.]
MDDVLVIENDPDDHPGRLGEWLAAAGLRLAVVRAHAGQEVPTDPSRYAGLVVLGGGQHAFPDPAGAPGAPWFPATESLLRAAVRERVPTLAICLGAQLLATAHGGRVEPAAAGPELGPALVARRDAAESDPLFGAVPFTPDVFQWHRDEVTELPPGAVLLAASTRCPYQAFRLGTAWGLQFHIEPDLPMVAGWAAADRDLLRQLGLAEADLLAATEPVLADLAEVWQPFAA